MTFLLLVLAVWLLLSVLTAIFFRALVRGGASDAVEPDRVVDLTLPLPRAHQDVRSVVKSG